MWQNPVLSPASLKSLREAAAREALVLLLLWFRNASSAADEPFWSYSASTYLHQNMRQRVLLPFICEELKTVHEVMSLNEKIKW